MRPCMQTYFDWDTPSFLSPSRAGPRKDPRSSHAPPPTHTGLVSSPLACPAGTPSLLIPSPYVTGDHQRKNALSMQVGRNEL